MSWEDHAGALSVAAVAASAAAVLFAVSLLFAVLAVAIPVIIGAFTGVALTAGMISPLVMGTGAVALAGGGIATSVYVVVRVMKGAQRHPFEWLAPILSAVGGFAGSLAEEMTGITGIPKGIAGGVAALLLLAGGIFWRRQGATAKSLGVAMFIFYPAALLWAAVASSHHPSSLLSQIRPTHWLGIGLYCICLLCVALLAYLSKDADAA